MTDIPAPDDFSRAPERAVFDWLDARALSHNTVEHAPTFTVSDSADVKMDMPGGHTKNLFMKDKKGNLVLVSAWANSELPLNQLHKLIGTQRLSFTKSDLLWDALKVTPGSVSAFALIHDADKRVRFIVDEALFGFESVNFHPLRCDMTTRLPIGDFDRFITETGRSVERVDFSALKG